jgi:ATP-binding cassette subfamily B protein
VEEGTHDALLAKGGLYARLARLQFTSERELSGSAGGGRSETMLAVGG